MGSTHTGGGFPDASMIGSPKILLPVMFMNADDRMCGGGGDLEMTLIIMRDHQGNVWDVPGWLCLPGCPHTRPCTRAYI